MQNSKAVLWIQSVRLWIWYFAYQKGFLASTAKKLSNERFVQNAKSEVVELERKKLADAEAKIKAMEESLARLDWCIFIFTTQWVPHSRQSLSGSGCIYQRLAIPIRQLQVHFKITRYPQKSSRIVCVPAMIQFRLRERGSISIFAVFKRCFHFFATAFLYWWL